MSKLIVSDNYLKDKSDRTNVFSDRLVPNAKAKATGYATGLAGAVIGAGVGLGVKKGTRMAIKKALSAETSKAIGKRISKSLAEDHEAYARVKRINNATKTPAKIFFSPEMAKVRNLSAAGAGALVYGKRSKRLGEVMHNTSTLKRQYLDQFGAEPSEMELLDTARLNPNKAVDRRISKLFFTPNATTKSNFRSIRNMANAPKVLDDREIDEGMNSFMMPQFKRAGFDSNGIDKIAFNPIRFAKASRKILTETAKRTEHMSKKGPLISAGLGAGATIPGSVILSKSLVDRDKKNKHIKDALLGATVAGVGGASGYYISKDAIGAIQSTANKVANPPKTVVDGLKGYAKMFTKQASTRDQLIEKIAKHYNQKTMTFEDHVSHAMRQRGMSHEQFNEFTDMLNKDYGANTKFKMVSNPHEAFAIMSNSLDEYENLRKSLGAEKNKHFIQSLPLEEVLLHETGHVKDKDLRKQNNKVNRLSNAASLTSLGSNIAGGTLKNDALAIGVNVGGVAGGTYLKHRSGKALVKREDNANEFARKYYAKKLGSQEKADEHLKNSILPHARRTYEHAGRVNTIAHGALYSTPMAYNAVRRLKK